MVHKQAIAICAAVTPRACAIAVSVRSFSQSRCSADLEAYLQWREAEAGQPLAPDQPLFVSYSPRNRGQRLTYSGIRQVMDQLAEATGIDLHFHRDRHTFATRLIVELEMDPTLAMELMRHRDPPKL